MSTKLRCGRGGAQSRGQAIVEYLVCTVLVALALIVPLDDEGSAAAHLVRAFEQLLTGFAWLVAIA